ncbi:MAG: 3'-5' exonuclease [Bacteriovoracaceae bacterium]|jgi:DNA polymerase-3 subunit alpha (Gram-positive type)|nr:3'-5' exonuclease [Bacteriovoracaceae bacterium]
MISFDDIQNQESKDLINSLDFCVIDLETTGGNHQNDKIIEIGLVQVSNFEIKDQLSFLINPQIKIPDFIQKLTSIKQKDVTNAPKIEDVIDQIIEFIGDRILVAHNTSFDIPFLNSVLNRLKKNELENKVICTNVMTKHLIPNITNSNLTYMSQLFNLNHKNAHRALDDAIATAELLMQYLNIFISKNIKKVNQLYYPKNKFELDRVHIKNNRKIEEILSFLSKIDSSYTITLKGEQGIILSVIPVEFTKDDLSFIKESLEELEWTILTIKLTAPYLDALLYYCTHYPKFSIEVQKKSRNYLSKKFHKNTKKINIDSLDFIISNHIINEQVIVYPFLNLKTKEGNNIFKVPAQQKKMYQVLVKNLNHFENNQKGKRKTYIAKDLYKIVESYLSQNIETGSYLYLSRKEIHNGVDYFINTISKYLKDIPNESRFPLKHL